MILYFNFSKELCIHKEMLYKGDRIVISRNMRNNASSMFLSVIEWSVVLAYSSKIVLIRFNNKTQNIIQ